MDSRTWKIAEDIQKERLAWAEHERLARLASESTKKQRTRRVFRWFRDKSALLTRFADRIGNAKYVAHTAHDIASEPKLNQIQLNGE